MERIEGLVLRAQSGHYQVKTGDKVVFCSLRGRIKYIQRTEEDRFLYADPVAVGDRVLISLTDDENGRIEDILPSKTIFSRRFPGRRKIEQIIVANADQMVVVISIKLPDFNFRFLDRFLIIAESGGLESIICVNKIDLATDEEKQRLASDLKAYEKVSYRTVYTSATEREGIEELCEILKDKFSVFVGASGVGKSSLLNAIQPGLGIKVAEVSEKTRKGKHTTSHVELFFLDFGGQVADTPGVREVAAWDISGYELDAYFVEMEPYLGKCKFSNCAHITEPGCAIKKAVEEGEISCIRYESYKRLVTA